MVVEPEIRLTLVDEPTLIKGSGIKVDPDDEIEDVVVVDVDDEDGEHLLGIGFLS